MEYSLASNGVNNAYFDRIIQNQVENDLHQITYCLKLCKLAHNSQWVPQISFQQKLCLRDCTKIVSLDISEDLRAKQQN